MWWIYSTPGWNRPVNRVNRSAKNWGGDSCPPAPIGLMALRVNEKAAKAAYSKSFPWKSNLEVH